MISQLEVGFMRHITHEKMKSHVVQGNAKLKISDQRKKPSSQKFEFVPVVTEPFSKQLHLFLSVYSDLCGCVLAPGDATSTTTGRDVQWQMSLEEAI